MERALKERIIGAVVLVVFVVLVVPIFLDGPPEDGAVVTERVLLPGQDEQKTQTVVLDRDRTEPVPTASTSQAQTPPEETPEQERPEPEIIERNEPLRIPPKPTPQPVDDEPAAEPPSQPATSTTGMWAVQIVAVSSKERAEDEAAKLRREGYAAFVSQLDSGSGTL